MFIPRFLKNMGIMVLLGLSLAMPAAVQADTAYTPQLLDSTPITAGAELKNYVWDASSGRMRFYVIDIDLSNPYVDLGVIPGGGLLTKRSGVSAMAKSYGAVAAINGDFFNTRGEGVPIGPMVYDGRLISSPSVLEGTYALGLDQNRVAHIEPFSFSGRVKAPDGMEFPLSGLNKSFYWEEPYGVHSHIDKMHVYNDMWGGVTRGQDSYTTPTEMLVYNGVVEDMIVGNSFNYPVPTGKFIVHGDGAAALFITDHFQIGSSIDLQYQIAPERAWSWVIGGHALLVDEGRKVPYTKDTASLGGVRSRMAAGISQDGRRLYLIGVEKSAWSTGASLDELSALVQGLGVWRAVNLDGGGSTTMVSRPLGEWQISRTFALELGSERAVVNALAVYAKAPPGQERNWIISGATLLLVGESSTYAIKGYDEYYNPLVSDWAAWSDSGGVGRWADSVFTAIKPGNTEVTAVLPAGSSTLPVRVIGREDIAWMSLNSDSAVLIPGNSYQLYSYMQTRDGQDREIPPQFVQWRLQGISGTVSPEGVLQVDGLTGTEPLVFVTAEYQGFTAPRAFLAEGRQHFDTFNTLENLYFDTYPENAGGGLSLVPDPAVPERQVTRLQYDLSAPDTGTRAAYARLAGDGLWLDDSVEGVAFDIYGAAGHEWVRAELVDGQGEKHRIDLATDVDWAGWQQVSLAVGSLPQPLMLRQIYVASSGTDGKNLAGTLLLDNLTLLRRPAEPPAPVIPNLELTVGQNRAFLNGAEVALDVPPLIWQDRTLVPLRFMAEAIGATVLWDAATQRVTVIRGRDWLDLWLGEMVMMKNGTPLELEVPAQLIEGRTMLPLRAIAESLAITVDWDGATQKIKVRA
jgi:hypothetical protein